MIKKGITMYDILAKRGIYLGQQRSDFINDLKNYDTKKVCSPKADLSSEVNQSSIQDKDLVTES